MRIFLLTGFCLLFCANSSAQQSDFRDMIRRRVIEKAYETIADPPRFEKQRDHLRLLDNRSVRLELRFAIEDWIKVQAIRKKSMAELSALSDDFVRISPKPFSWPEVVEALNEQEADKIRSLLTDAQVDRLAQLVHYVEIAYLGLPKALAEGNLGREVGLYENQVHNIFKKGNEILNESEIMLSEIRKNTHEQIVALLPPENQAKAQTALGRYFQIGGWTIGEEDYRKSQLEELSLSGNGISMDERYEAVPEPIQLLTFLFHDEVWHELALTTVQVSSLMAAKDRSRGEGADAEAVLDELLSSQQRKRLEQVYNFLVLTHQGYSRALFSGHIGRVLAVPTDLHPKLQTAVRELEVHRDQEIQDLQQKSHERILQLLSSEQQKTADKLQGRYFLYVDGTIASSKAARQMYLESQKN